MGETRLDPPRYCDVFETEGLTLGSRMAVRLDKIRRLVSLSQASKAAGIDLAHTRELAEEMIISFKKPLIDLNRSYMDYDRVNLKHLVEDTVYWYLQIFGPVWSTILEERSRYYCIKWDKIKNT